MITNLFYALKPYIPRRVQLVLRQNLILFKRVGCGRQWPIDATARLPLNKRFHWPANKNFGLVLTHDIDTARGQERCHLLAEEERKLGFRSSFNFVPERYNVDMELIRQLSTRGFEIGVHGLYHDGKLYKSHSIFKERTLKINQYLKSWNAVGFRSPAMHHNLEWLKALDIEYDASTFDTDPFEPQPDGVGTIFPFPVFREDGSCYMELPYTLPQDFTLFILMREKNIDIWKRKLDWIAINNGMALLNTHPDYMCFSGKKSGVEEYPIRYYREFLEFVKNKYNGQYWHGLPKELTQYCKENIKE